VFSLRGGAAQPQHLQKGGGAPGGLPLSSLTGLCEYDEVADGLIPGVLQCVAVCCSVLQCVAVCCSVLRMV